MVCLGIQIPVMMQTYRSFMQLTMKNFFLAFFALSKIASAAVAPRITPTVRVRNGTIAGIHSSTYKQDFFLGIAFAQPPIGDLRFRQPQSLNTSWEGTRYAKNYATHCVGYGVRQTKSVCELILNPTARSNLLSGIRRLPLPEHCPSFWVPQSKTSSSLLDTWRDVHKWRWR